MFNHDAFILVEPGELIIYSNHLISLGDYKLKFRPQKKRSMSALFLVNVNHNRINSYSTSVDSVLTQIQRGLPVARLQPIMLAQRRYLPIL